jgi:hypothetical protein
VGRKVLRREVIEEVLRTYGRGTRIVFHQDRQHPCLEKCECGDGARIEVKVGRRRMWFCSQACLLGTLAVDAAEEAKLMMSEIRSWNGEQTVGMSMLATWGLDFHHIFRKPDEREQG